MKKRIERQVFPASFQISFSSTSSFINIFSAKDNDSDDHRAHIFADETDQELLGPDNLSDDGALDIDNLPAMNSMFGIFSLVLYYNCLQILQRVCWLMILQILCQAQNYLQ